MKRVAVIGLGLMGGSLALALRKRDAAGTATVYGYARRKETRDLALSLGAADYVFDEPGDAVREADLVVFCAPILTIPELARRCAPCLLPNAIVTDVGSTKADLVAKMKAIPCSFIGSHPIAGSEQTGLNAARADLYDGAVVVLTPERRTDQTLLASLGNFWKSLGADVVVMSPEEHDSLIARTSHLPHLVAAMLADCVGGNGPADSRLLCGTGFRDTTRISEGSPDVWHDIVATNADAISREIERFRDLATDVAEMIRGRDFAELKRFLERSRLRRRNLLG